MFFASSLCGAFIYKDSVIVQCSMGFSGLSLVLRDEVQFKDNIPSWCPLHYTKSMGTVLSMQKVSYLCQVLWVTQKPM